MTSNKGDFQRQLALLRRQFADSLDDKFVEIEELLQKLVHGDDSGQTIHRLLLKAHNMSGTSASFGYSLLGERAKRLEFFLKKVGEAHEKPSKDQLERISGMLISLREAAELTRWELNDGETEETTIFAKPAVPGNNQLYFLDGGRIQTESLIACLELIGYRVRIFSGMTPLSAAVSDETPAAVLIDWDYRNAIDPATFESFSGNIPILCLTNDGGLSLEEPLPPVDVTCMIDVTDFVTLSAILEECAGGPIPDPYRILLIDEDPIRAEHHAYLLENAGMWTRLVADATEIPNIYSTFRPELVWVTLGDEPIIARYRPTEESPVPPRAYFCPESHWENRGFALRTAGEDVFPLPPDQTRLIWFTAGKAKQTRRIRGLVAERQALLGEPTDLMDSLDAPICHTDRIGRITRANTEFLVLTQTSLPEIMGKDIRLRLNPPERVWSEVQQGRTWSGVIEPNGHPCDCKVIPFSDNGQPQRLGWLFFPRDAADANSAPSGRPWSVLSQTEPKPRAAKSRILIVEDNPINRKIMTRLLDQSGHLVDSVTDGQAAVNAFVKQRYDLVFMDCRMPIMDGLEATIEIRKREKPGQRTPIIALTADESNTTRAECLRVGMDDHLTKPVEPDSLSSLLNRYLSRSDPQNPTAQPAQNFDSAVHVAFDLLRRAVRQSDPTAIEVRFGLIHHFFIEQGRLELAAMIQEPRRQAKTAHAWTILDWISCVEAEYRRHGQRPGLK